MTPKIRFMFALDAIGQNKRGFLGEVFLMFISLFFMAVAVFMMVQADYCRDSLEQVLIGDIEQTGILCVDDYSAEAALDFYQEACASAHITAIGPIGVGATDIVPELASIQQGHQINIYNSKRSVEMHYIKAGVLPLCNMELEQGDFISETGSVDDRWTGLYLGYAYKDIPVGTIYTYELSDNTTLYFEVLGIMKEGSRFVSEEILRGNEAGSTCLYNEVDYGVLAVQGGYIMDGSWVFGFSGVSYQEIKKELSTLAKKHGIDIEISSLAADLSKADRENAYFQGLLKKLAFLFGFTAAFFILSFQLMNVWKRAPEYGVLYALGAETRDIVWIVIYTAVIKLTIAFLLMQGVISWFIPYYFSSSSDIPEVMQNLLVQHVYGVVFSGGILISMLGIILPIIQIGRMAPVDLLHLKTTNGNM